MKNLSEYRKALFSPDTEIFTTNGWEFVTKINSDDNIAVLQNSNLVFTELLSVSNNEYIGKIFDIKNEAIEAILFPECNYFCHQTINGKLKSQIVKSPKTMCIKNTFKWTPVDVVTLPPHLLQNDFIKFLCYYIKFGKIEFLLNRQTTKPKIIKRVKISCKNEKDANELKTILLQVNKILPFELDCKIKNLDFIISNNSVGLFLQKFGYQKCSTIIDEVKNMPPEYLSIFVNMMFPVKEAKFFCENEKLAEDILEIILKSGKSGVLQNIENGFIVKCFNKKDTGVKINPSCISSSQFNGTVYIIELPNLPILVRKNGKCCWL